jgi:hypothetical protein
VPPPATVADVEPPLAALTETGARNRCTSDLPSGLSAIRTEPQNILWDAGDSGTTCQRVHTGCDHGASWIPCAAMYCMGSIANTVLNFAGGIISGVLRR